jgi:FkbM family methyltransferase
MGWSGILLDPVSKNIDLASRQRPRDRCLRAICGSAGGECDFWEYSPSELSTTSPNRVQELSNSGHTPIDRYSVQSITIKDLQISTTPKDPFVLSIDVEGAEFDVLNGCDWESFLPAIVVLEQHSPPWLENSPSGNLLISKGYELSDYAGLSSVYIHNQSPFRIQRDESVQQ